MKKKKTTAGKTSASKRRITRTPKPTARPARASAKLATRATARRVAAFALEKKAADVLVMDVRKVTDVARFFIVCTGHSAPQVKAIADHVIDSCRDSKLGVYHVEGYDSLRWVLIDLVDIVVHVFQPEVRGYYQLERLWGDARVERVEDAAAGALS